MPPEQPHSSCDARMRHGTATDASAHETAGLRRLPTFPPCSSSALHAACESTPQDARRQPTLQD